MNFWIRRIVALVTVGGFAVSLAGCAEMARYWPKELNLAPPPSAKKAGETQASPAVVSPIETELAPPEQGLSEPASPTSNKPPAEVAAPQSKPTVTLRGEANSRVRAERLLSAAQSALSEVDQTKLTGENKVTYAQASNFVGAAQKALQVRDYVTAAGLAKKAFLLADEVKTAAAPPGP